MEHKELKKIGFANFVRSAALIFVVFLYINVETVAEAHNNIKLLKRTSNPKILIKHESKVTAHTERDGIKHEFPYNETGVLLSIKSLIDRYNLASGDDAWEMACTTSDILSKMLEYHEKFGDNNYIAKNFKRSDIECFKTLIDFFSNLERHGVKSFYDNPISSLVNLANNISDAIHKLNLPEKQPKKLKSVENIFLTPASVYNAINLFLIFFFVIKVAFLASSEINMDQDNQGPDVQEKSYPVFDYPLGTGLVLEALFAIYQKLWNIIQLYGNSLRAEYDDINKSHLL